MRPKYFILYLFIFAFGTQMRAQQNNLDEITRQYKSYCSQGLFRNASNLLVDKAHELFEKGDTLNAYELQIENCLLTDEHLEDFLQHGLNWEEYFSNWYITISWAEWINKKEEVLDDLLRILEMISQKEPRLLPFYCNSLGYILYDYRIVQDNDPLFVLQKALDYIKSLSPSHELVDQYNNITKCFYINRFYNSYDKNIFIRNRIDELDKWYKYNLQYINSLDTLLFKQEILDYELLYVDQIMSYARTIDSQEGRSDDAIEMYLKAISSLEPLVLYNDTLSQKIAACYSRIASIYVGDKVLCKEYADKAIPYLVKHKENFDFCDILDALSQSYYYTNQYEIAANLKLAEIHLREKLGWRCSQLEWSVYFLYIVDSHPTEVISLSHKLKNIDESIGGSPMFYSMIGRAYSMLMDSNENYRDTAELYFNKVDSLVLKYGYETYNAKNGILSTLCEERATHYLRLGERENSYEYSKKALVYNPNSRSCHNVIVKSALLHDTTTIHSYLPQYYYGYEEEICKMLPTLGSLESDMYLDQGEISLYHVPEWASWNPTDSVCVSIAYNAALLMKGLTLRYNSLAPYYEKYPEIVTSKTTLDRMRDSIYAISDDNTRLLALHRYQIKEREILKEVNSEMTNVHWEDIYRGLKEDEACIEFVKYTKNVYSWSEGVPTPHYAALILSTKTSFPVFVDLFDENELMDVYNLQPKSYDTGMGKSLYSRIWGILKKYIEGKNRVYFSPAGLLNLINIENLTNDTGKTALEEFNLYRVSSTKKILDKQDEINISCIASFGGIDYKDSSEYADITNMMNTRGNWNFLHNTLSEVSQIKRFFNNKVNMYVFTGKNATESAFKKLDGTKSNIIHIASHGYYIPQSNRMTVPYFKNSDNTRIVQDELFYSGIVLSGGQNSWINSSFGPDNNDGILSSYEISKLDLHNVNLVVLSACETGLGDNLYDGIFGLQRAFKKAGAKSILMSLWQIDDKATSEYMSLFYKKLSNGYSIHDAYIGTVLDMKKKYIDPYYWASFVLLD